MLFLADCRAAEPVSQHVHCQQTSGIVPSVPHEFFDMLHKNEPARDQLQSLDELIMLLAPKLNLISSSSNWRTALCTVSSMHQKSRGLLDNVHPRWFFALEGTWK